MQNRITLNLKTLIDNKKPHFLLAVSGGIDSMVLLNFFQKNHESFTFSVAHINHNYHSDAKKMENLVKDQCEQNGNNLIIENIFLNEVNSNIESNFRKMRYSKLEEIRKDIKADFILTAHHADDQVETILMKIMNSSGLDGLQGLRKLKQNIIRPMYNIPKSEILAKAKKDKLKFVKDPSNKDISFDRNYLRNKVLPEIENRWPSYRKNLNQLIENLKESSDLLITYAEKDFNEVKVKKNLISLKKFLSLSKIRQKRVFIFWINLNGLNQPSARVINLFFSKFLKDEKTPKAKYMWGTTSKKGSVCITKNTHELRISELSA